MKKIDLSKIRKELDLILGLGLMSYGSISVLTFPVVVFMIGLVLCAFNIVKKQQLLRLEKSKDLAARQTATAIFQSLVVGEAVQDTILKTWLEAFKQDENT